jgi:anti-sigma factor RsiW
MIKPQSWTSREEALLLINAYLDGELDAAAAVEVERRMGADATLQAEYDRLLNLRTRIASGIGKDHASDVLRARIAAIAGPDEPALAARPAKTLARRFDWRQMAAAMLIAAFLGSGASYLVLQSEMASDEVVGIVAGHQRALLAAAPVDVASTDRHTVKPWFDGKLALSPRIVDLAAEGFPLIGGRVEVLKGQAVSVLVYRRRDHLVSVVAAPKRGGKDDGASARATTRDGYGLRIWRGSDFVYYAVADLPAEELDSFVASWRQQAARE